MVVILNVRRLHSPSGSRSTAQHAHRLPRTGQAYEAAVARFAVQQHRRNTDHNQLFERASHTSFAVALLASLIPIQGLNGLHLKYNKISVVPTEIGTLQNLQELDLEGTTLFCFRCSPSCRLRTAGRLHYVVFIYFCMCCRSSNVALMGLQAISFLNSRKLLRASPS